MTVPTGRPAAVRSTGSQTSTAIRTPSSAGTYTDWRRRDGSISTSPILAQALRSGGAQAPLAPPPAPSAAAPRDGALGGDAELGAAGGGRARWEVGYWLASGTSSRS